jgi:hypothetical protein
MSDKKDKPPPKEEKAPETPVETSTPPAPDTPKPPKPPAPPKEVETPKVTAPTMKMKVSIPSLEAQDMKFNFGRMDPMYQVVDHELLIEDQKRMIVATYETICSEVTIDLDLTLEEFTYIWKLCLLKRVTDAYEAAKQIRSDGFVRIGRNLVVPGPLADLLHSIGFFHSKVDGKVHHTIPPPKPTPPEAWYTTNPTIIQKYIREMARISPVYVMKEFPAMNQCADKPMMLTMKRETQNLGIVKAWTKEPKLTDAFVRLCNDNLYKPHKYMTYENSSLTMTQELYIPQVINHYVGSYVINTY